MSFSPHSTQSTAWSVRPIPCGTHPLTLYRAPSTRSAIVDLNKDGEVSQAELREWLLGYGYKEELVAKIFAGIDFDASGGISNEELRKAFVEYPTLRTAPGLGRLENVSVRSTWPALDDGKTIPEIYAMADAVL